MLILLITAGIILAFTGALIGGRPGGLGVTALYGLTLAFFVMPPRFSLRVTHRQDILALAFYGAAGLVLTETTPSAKKKREPARARPRRDFNPRQHVETDLALAISHVMSSDLGMRLRALGFSCSAESFHLPCTSDDTLCVLTDVLTAAIETPGVRRVSIYVGQRPGVRQLIVAAHCTFPAPRATVVTIGKRDLDCESITFTGWPVHALVTRFDNGYDRIFQVSANTERPAETRITA